MNYYENSGEARPGVYPDEFWDAEREEGYWESEPAEQGFAQGGAWDDRLADPVLAMSVVRTAEGGVSGLGDNELLGAIAAAERTAGQAAWAVNALAAEYAKRTLEWDSKLGREVIPEFGEEDYRQELAVSGMTARASLNRSLTLDQMPQCMRLAHDGALDGFRQRIIAEEAGVLDPVLIAKADGLIAKDAIGRTPGSLRNYCRKIVFTLDPQQAEKRRQRAAKGRRIEFWPEQSGNVTMAAREMSVAVAAGIKQSLTAWAKIMRATGIEGSMDNLRHDAAAALLLGRHPVTGTPAGTVVEETGGDDRDPEAAYLNPWGFGDFEPGKEAAEPPVPGSPMVNIHLVITAGTLDQKTDAPGYVPEFGWVTGQVARDLITAGSEHPATRWCVTEVDSGTGEAVAHGCARGRHRWPPPDGGPPGGHSGSATPPLEPGVAEFLTSLNLKTEPIARTSDDDGHAEPRHDPSRELRHLIEARNATCATPACDAAAVTSDMEHRIPWEDGGETSEHNIDPGHRHCHRLKQHKGWRVEKTGPCETRWTGPSGRTRIVRPTRYQ
jgi:hypothetical protein